LEKFFGYRIVITKLNSRRLKVKTQIYIQGVPGGKDLTSGECTLGQTIPI
jgi:hypothetical protein